MEFCVHTFWSMMRARQMLKQLHYSLLRVQVLQCFQGRNKLGWVQKKRHLNVQCPDRQVKLIHILFRLGGHDHKSTVSYAVPEHCGLTVQMPYPQNPVRVNEAFP